MKKPFPFFPPLLAVFPVLSIYASNVQLVSPTQIWRPLVVVVGVTVALWLVLAAVTRDWMRGAIAATVGIGMCLAYQAFMTATTLNYYAYIGPMAWAALTLTLMVVFAWKWRNPAILNVLSVVLLALAGTRVALAFWSESGKPAPVRLTQSQDSQTLPDVYYFILDGYGRSDVLRKYYDVDNQPFLDSLHDRGFVVANASAANFIQTELSLSATLNLNYLQDLVNPGEYRTRSLFTRLIDQSEAITTFQEHGYRFVAVTSGFPPLEFRTADVRLDDSTGANLIETYLIQLTPLRSSQSTLDSLYDDRRRRVMVAFENLRDLASRTAGPRFIVTHILAPHPPFVFGPNGEPKRPKGPFGYWDGSDYMTHVGDQASYQTGYAEQVQYLNVLLRETIDYILANNRRDAIIILQGDHGPKMHLDQADLSKTDIQESFPILNAILMPKEWRHEYYPGVSPVNTFRILFRHLFKMDTENLPDRHYYSPYDDPLNFTQVEP
ncbi:MAG: sulfatase-like hydrolase/transferase [Fimbriimonadaceae bacterium]